MNLGIIGLPTMCIALIFFILTYIRYNTKKIYSQKYIIFRSFFSFYICFLIGLTLFPIPQINHAFSLEFALKSIHLEPIKPLIHMIRTGLQPDQSGNLSNLPIVIINILGNVVLLMPFAFFMRRLYSFNRIVILLQSMLVSFSIELLQTILDGFSHIDYRIADINDFLLNVLGVIIYLLFSKLISICFPAINRPINKKRKRKTTSKK